MLHADRQCMARGLPVQLLIVCCFMSRIDIGIFLLSLFSQPWHATWLNMERCPPPTSEETDRMGPDSLAGVSNRPSRRLEISFKVAFGVSCLCFTAGVIKKGENG